MVNRGTKHKLTWKERDEIYKERGRVMAIRCSPGSYDELKSMNRRKVGRPFQYPHSMMAYIAICRSLMGLP